jgi:hypothetical protein
MTQPQQPPHGDALSAFLVERYLSPAAAVDLAASTSRMARLCADGEVRYLYSAYLPAEDTCFCLFQAPSAGAVRAVNQQAHFDFDRLIDAVVLHGRQGRSS